MANQKQFSIKWLTVALVLCLMVGMGACKEDDDNSTSYIGTWERTDDSEFGMVKQVLVISEASFNMSMKINLLNAWMDMMVIKGTYTVNGDIFTLTITEIGVPNEDMSGLVYYTPNDAEWEEILADEAEIEDSFDAKFELSGNTLTIITDDNYDGTFDPVEEGETFTRV